MPFEYEGITLRAVRDPWTQWGVKFALFENRDGKLWAASPPVMSPVDPTTLVRETFTLSNEACQSLMDSLWDAGVRPTAGAGSAGQLAATERHLEDMRSLVFKENK